MIQICGESIPTPLKIKNYRPVSLLPILSKTCEKVIYNAQFNYFKNNKIFTTSQSEFLFYLSFLSRTFMNNTKTPHYYFHALHRHLDIS